MDKSYTRHVETASLCSSSSVFYMRQTEMGKRLSGIEMAAKDRHQVSEAMIGNMFPYSFLFFQQYLMYDLSVNQGRE